YGAWAIIQQSTNYLAVADLRPTGALKLTLGVAQHEYDYSAKRRQVGAAVHIWLRTLPILIILGLGLVLAIPSITGVSEENITQVRIAMLFTTLNVCLAGILTIPDNVLRGSNLDYKAMGLSGLAILTGGLITALNVLGGM